MLKEPLVSAVIITYNQEKYIEQTIDCALAQKVDFPYEIIIGEDCSTDQTREICLRYQAKYPEIIRVITSEKNLGLLDNWYSSVKAARGKYIAVCAGDDYWHNPEKLQKQVKFLEENAEYGMIHSDADILKEDEGRIIKNFHKKSKIFYDNTSNNTLDLLFSGRYQVVACSSVFRKIYFDKYFDINELKKNDIIMEDMPLWIIIAAHSKIYYMPESFMTHREMKGTITNPISFEKKMKIWQSCKNCFIYYFKQYQDRINDKNITLKSIHQGFSRIMQILAMQANRKDLVREYYLLIKESDISSLSVKDKIRFYSTYIPCGIKIYNVLLILFSHLKAMTSGIPKR